MNNYFTKKNLLIFALLLTHCQLLANDDENYPPEEYLSGTLPVLYINTQDSAPITSKKIYIPGTYYLDPNGIEGVEGFGSAEAPLPLEIKGRGNASWLLYPKKPYKIKLDKKTPLLGMPKSKHWVLMARWTDAGVAYLKEEIGFELSRRMNMAWTSRHQPVELVINGQYYGLYFITENVRVEKNRVDVLEQADEETDPDLVTGGWLIEKDNYADANQIVFTEGDGEPLRITYKTPEVLSVIQREYLSNLITTTDSLIYLPDKLSRDWEDYIDLDTLVRFYIINEMVDNIEAFHGSCFMHKHYGDNTKLIFGPVWDFGNSFGHNTATPDCFLYENTTYRKTWIKEIVKYPRFQQRVRLLWDMMKDTLYSGIDEYMELISNPLIDADRQNNLRWKGTLPSTSIANRRERYKRFFYGKNNWLQQQWEIKDNSLDSILTSRKDNEYVITNDLYVAAINNGIAYVTDNNDVWLGILMDEYAPGFLQIKTIKGGTMRGYATFLDTNPLLLLDKQPESVEDGNEPIIKTYAAITPSMSFTGNSVIDIVGEYHDGFIYGDSSMLVIKPEYIETELQNGTKYKLRGIIRLKQSWNDWEQSLTGQDELYGYSNSLIECDRNNNYEFLVLEILSRLADDYDLNGDGIVDIEDVNAAVNIALKLSSAAEYPGNADLDGNGIVDVEDVSALVNKILYE